MSTRFQIVARVWLAAVLLVVAGAGCAGKGDDRYPVSGTVRLGDEPVRGGFVVIEPLPGGAVSVPQGYARIRDGTFDTRAGGEPAPAGPVIVRVHGTGAPTDRFPNGVPLCHGYEFRMDLAAGPNTLELAVPVTARLKEPKGGWGEGP